MQACITGVASPLVDPRHRVPPRMLGLQVIETVRQWGKEGPTGTEGDGLLVSRAWRSRALGMVLAQNKVVPLEPRKGRHHYSDGQFHQWVISPTYLATDASQMEETMGNF